MPTTYTPTKIAIGPVVSIVSNDTTQNRANEDFSLIVLINPQIVSLIGRAEIDGVLIEPNKWVHEEKTRPCHLQNFGKANVQGGYMRLGKYFWHFHVWRCDGDTLIDTSPVQPEMFVGMWRPWPRQEKETEK